MAITPKSVDKYVEKCSTAQSFIRTEMSTYRIGTLEYCPNIYTVFLEKVFQVQPVVQQAQQAPPPQLL